MSGLASGGSRRSPARSNLRSTSVKSRLAKSPQKAVLVSPIKRRTDDSVLIERDRGPKNSQEAQGNNTPQHLHGLDNPEDILDNKSIFEAKKGNVQSENAIERNAQFLWHSTSWKKTILMLLAIVAALQAFLWWKGSQDPFRDLNVSGDAAICLRSYDELRKKLAMAFELITESGKLFKQLERQSKHQYEQMDMKHNSLNSKATTQIEKMRKQLAVLEEAKSRKDNTDFGRFSDKEFPVDLSEMHSLIEIALERYDADKIGIPDYALESAGARIHVPYHSPTHSSGWPIMKVFGIVVWQDTRTPRELIKPENLPGNCWPLEGQKGYVVIKLAARIIPSMVTMEHLHHSLARFSDDTLQSMPKNFSVYSWSTDQGNEKTFLGSYIYSQHGKARQTFPIQTVPDAAVEYAELRIESNYGNKDFTCIYRFRVHGEPDQTKEPSSGGS